MMYPTVESKGQIQKMKKNPRAANRLQDIWIWNGRPNWDNVFENMKAERQHSDIGVCFCGAPAIGSVSGVESSGVEWVYVVLKCVWCIGFAEGMREVQQCRGRLSLHAAQGKLLICIYTLFYATI